VGGGRPAARALVARQAMVSDGQEPAGREPWPL